MGHPGAAKRVETQSKDYKCPEEEGNHDRRVWEKHSGDKEVRSVCQLWRS